MIILGAIFATIVIGLGVGAIFVISVWNQTPSLASLHQFNVGDSSIVYAADGQRLGFIQGDNLRTPIPSEQIPAVMKQATVAIEDQRFYHHNGVDFQGIVRAFVKNITSGKTVQGGSTITMQLVRNLYIGNERTLSRKLKEAKLAMDFEHAHTKDYILADYLNTVPYGTVGGQSAIGVQAAARIFFNKPAGQLTLPQAATLAGLPQAPSDYNPFDNPQAALARRNEVLTKMAQLHYVTPAAAAAAAATPLRVHHSDYYTVRRENFFFDYVKQQLIDRYGANTVLKGGLRIYTTIDLRLQNLARAAMTNVLNQPGDPASAIVSVDPRNGYIRAMAESPRYDQSQFNLAAQGHRQPGSTFKVMVLATALKQGVDPNSTYYESKPLMYTDPVWGPINVQTYSHSYSGSINLVEATLKSDNTVYEQLDLDVGPKNVAATAHELGVVSPLQGYPAEGLGGLRVGVTPLEMANTYATLADGGLRNTPTAITRVVFPGPDGRVDSFSTPHRVRVISDGIAGEVTNILHQNMLSGTAVAANINCPDAGKTGTTDNFTDAWLDGYTPHMSTVVWVGYPKAKIPMTNVHGIQVQGGSFPAQIWHQYMQGAVGGDCAGFPQPQNPISYVPFSGAHQSGGSGSGSGTSYGSASSGSPSGTSRRPTSGNSGANGNGGNVGPPSYQRNPGAYAGPPQPSPSAPPPGISTGNGNGNLTGGAGGPSGH